MYTESLSYSALKSEVFLSSARFKLCIFSLYSQSARVRVPLCALVYMLRIVSNGQDFVLYKYF